MTRSFSYDDLGDSIIISNKNENEIVKHNFEVGDIILSLTGKGKIISIEIREFSSFLENCNISPDIIKSIQDIELKILLKKETIFLVLVIKSLSNNTIISKEIPVIMPLINS